MVEDSDTRSPEELTVVPCRCGGEARKGLFWDIQPVKTKNRRRVAKRVVVVGKSRYLNGRKGQQFG